MVEKMGNFGDVLSARILDRSLFVGELSKQRHIDP